MAKRILILGASGFIGSYLFESLTSCGHTITGTYHNHPKPEMEHLDMLNIEQLQKTIARVRPELIIFLSGTKEVGRCEKDIGYAIDLNVQTVRNYLFVCDSLGIQPETLYFSTDYVFDGVIGHYRNTDSVGAKTIYGITNILAERLFQNSQLPVLLLRVSAVMGKRGGFFRWLEESLQNDRQISLFDNSYFSPTSIARLCHYVTDIASQTIKQGVKIVHLSDGYRVSRFQFGQLMAEKMAKPTNLILAEKAVFNNIIFQADLSLLPDNITVFKNIIEWNELKDIF